MKEFNNKVVVITGGATGIGFALAKQFGKLGARILIAGRRNYRLEEAAEKLRSMDIDTEYYICDVACANEVESLADYAWDTFGQVDVIVNNAGVAAPSCPIVETSTDTVRELLDINLFGVWHGCQVFGKRFIEQGTPAAIYNMGSEASLFLNTPNNAPYSVSKHAVLALTESLRREMPEFIDVGLICPGIVQSEITEQDIMENGMDTDRFAALAMDQIRQCEFYIISHAHNIVHINERYEEISSAYTRYAPRYDGDEEFDVLSLIERLKIG